MTAGKCHGTLTVPLRDQPVDGVDVTEPGLDADRRERVRDHAQSDRPRLPRQRFRVDPQQLAVSVDAPARIPSERHRVRRKDRKSTRLNSSHQ